MWEKIEAVLSRIRPAVNADGGDIELIEVIGRSAKVRMVGSCAGCPSSMMTLHLGIERLLKEEIPEFEELIPTSPFEGFGSPGFPH
ncbi:MAG: NifU family protein [candidate division NC10 bacterium]|nr:NifU family protein [candidate division NC10 bacterium]